MSRLSSFGLEGTVLLAEDGSVFHLPPEGDPRRWEWCPVVGRWRDDEYEDLTPQQQAELRVLLGPLAAA